MSKLVQFPAWLPDQLRLGNVLTIADNVLPYQTGYAPVGSFSAVSDAMPAAFNGGASFISTDGNAYLIGGTAAGLYRMAGGAWSALVTGLTVAGRWRFVQFGNYALAVNETETREVNLATATDGLVAAAPGGVAIAVIGGHVFIAQPDGAMLDVAWSALNDRSGWTPGTDGAGQETVVTGGEVMGVAGGEYGILLQRERLVRIDATGEALAPFSFNEITSNYGCASTASIVQAGRTVFFLSDRGFMALDDGQAIRPIGNEKFDRHFRETVAREDWEKLWAAVDPRRTMVFWGMPGSPGKIWAYNWALDRATTISLPFEGLFAGYEAGVTLEALDALFPSGIDSMTYSLDDARWAGGAPALYLVSGAMVGTLSGTPLAAKVRQGLITPTGEARTRLRGVWPEIDATDGVTCRVEAMQRMGDAPDAVSFATMQASGRVPLRVSGKYMAMEFSVAAGTDWSLFTGYRIEATAAGVRT